MVVESAEVKVEGNFGGPAEPASNAVYQARVKSQADEDAMRALVQRTDQVAEIQNTVRQATPNRPTQLESICVQAH